MATIQIKAGNPVVVIVDDDALVRRSLEALFRSVDFAVLAFGSAHDLLDADLPDVPACLVIDVRMPQMGGFECHGQLLDRGIDIPAIFLTGHGDIPMTVKAMKAGAVDFLTKPYREQDILEAVYAGLSSATVKRSADEQTKALRERYALLTRRERQVMDGVVRGLLNKQIAGKIGISEITVKLHRSSMMRKMEMRTVPDLVRAADAIATQFASDGSKIKA